MSSEPRRPAASLIPEGYGVRLALMLGVLVLIGVTIYNLRRMAQPPAAPRQGTVAYDETIVPGLTDQEPVELDEVRTLFDAVLDKSELSKFDMPAYWRLVRWSRAQPFADLEKRAQRDVPFTALFQDPEKHRGELIRLRLHVERALKWDATKNSADVNSTYDIWGVTDESQANPYAVVTTEVPPNFPLGTNTSAEAVFVGYFLKMLAYQGGDGKQRGAPLLIGRIRLANVPQPQAVKLAGAAAAKKGAPAGNGAAAPAGNISWLITGGGIALLAMLLLASWAWRLTRRTRPAFVLPKTGSHTVDVESWLERFPAEAAEEVSAAEDRSRAETNGASGNGAPHA